MVRIIPLSLLVAFSLTARGETLTRTHHLGEAKEQTIRFASWHDDSTVVYWRDNGTLECKVIDSGEVKWTRAGFFAVSDWSVSRPAGRLAFKYSQSDEEFSFDPEHVCVINCIDGTTLFDGQESGSSFAGSQKEKDSFATILQSDFTFVGAVSLTPRDGRLVLTESSPIYGLNGYVFSKDFKRVLYRFGVDANPKHLSVSSDGNRITVIADDDVLCIREVKTNKDVLLRGQRRIVQPERGTFVIGPPFLSRAFSDGEDTLVCLVNGGCWNHDSIQVERLALKKSISIDTQGGYATMDVDFSLEQVVLGDDRGWVTIVDFAGNPVATLGDAIQGRVASVEFSPNSKSVLVGSDDNTLSVFSIVE